MYLVISRFVCVSSAVLCCAVLRGAVQCCCYAVQCYAVRCCTVAMLCCAVQCYAVRWGEVLCCTVLWLCAVCCAVLCGAVLSCELRRAVLRFVVLCCVLCCVLCAVCCVLCAVCCVLCAVLAVQRRNNAPYFTNLSGPFYPQVLHGFITVVFSNFGQETISPHCCLTSKKCSGLFSGLSLVFSAARHPPTVGRVLTRRWTFLGRETGNQRNARPSSLSDSWSNESKNRTTERGKWKALRRMRWRLSL